MYLSKIEVAAFFEFSNKATTGSLFLTVSVHFSIKDKKFFLASS